MRSHRLGQTLTFSVLVAALGIYSACVGDSTTGGGADTDAGNDGASSVDGSITATDGSTPTDGSMQNMDDSSADAGPPPPATGTISSTFTYLYNPYQVFPFSSAFDASGNLIVGGYYIGPIDFGNGCTLPTTVGAGRNGFILKVAKNGTCTWAAAVKAADQGGADVSRLATIGDEIVFMSDASGTSAIQLDGAAVPIAGSNGFVIGRLLSTGKQRWLNPYGVASPSGIAADGSGNIAIIIEAAGPSISLGATTSGNVPYTGLANTYVALLDDIGTLNAKWVKAVPIAAGSDGGSGPGVFPQAVAFTTAGDVATGGRFVGTVNLSFGEVTSKNVISGSSGSEQDGYVATYAKSNGQFLWGSALGMVHGQVTSMAASSSGVYVAVEYQGAFNAGGTAMPAFGLGDVGILHYSTSGGLLTANGYGSPSTEFITSILVDRWDEVIVGGFTSGTIDFGKKATVPGNSSQQDMFLAKLSPSSSCLWAYGFGSPMGQDELYSASVDHDGNVGFVGNLYGNGTLLQKSIVGDAGSPQFAFAAISSP